MKRLTEKRESPLVMSMWAKDSQSLRIYNRLAAIEDILGDDYDLDRLAVMCNQRMTMRDEVSERFSLTAKIPLDRLRELVELYSNVPHICDYCIGCEIEPTDGHGCDGYDNFVFSVRRIVAALKAREQDG